MFRALVFGVCALAFAPLAAWAQTPQQTLVDRATLAVQEIINDNPAGHDAAKMIAHSRAVMICPRVFKAGFIFGGQGGGCVLVGRGAVGWSPPAFYDMGSGSVGFQAGIQDSQILLIVLTERGLRALLDSQFKIGGDASLAFATVGLGVQGATTAALDADIVAFQNNRGLFAGISIDGSLLSSRSEWDATYYGQALAPQQIVLQGAGNNPGANPLREVLSRYTSQAPAPVTVAESPYAPQMPPPPPQPPYPGQSYSSQSYSGQSYSGQSYSGPMQLAPASRGSVQSAPLPPPTPR